MADFTQEGTMIKYDDKEIEEARKEALMEHLREDADYDYHKANPDKYFDSEEQEDDELDEYLEQNIEKFEAEFLRANQTGTYNCHEALENASDIMNLASKLCDKSAIIAHPEWFKMAHEASIILFNLYQAIGAAHLEAVPDNILDIIEEHKRKVGGDK